MFFKFTFVFGFCALLILSACPAMALESLFHHERHTLRKDSAHIRQDHNRLASDIKNGNKTSTIKDRKDISQNRRELHSERKNLRLSRIDRSAVSRDISHGRGTVQAKK